MKAQGPGLEPSGVVLNKPTEFTVDAKHGGKGNLKVQMQVGIFGEFGDFWGVLGGL